MSIKAHRLLMTP